jgi:hypothetical protein
MYYPYRKSTIDYATRTEVLLAAFNYNVTWLGVSDLLSTWDINNTTEFSIQLPVTAPNDTFLLCVAWTDEDGNALRYKLWDGGVLHYPIYGGERIGVDAQLEVWSIDDITASLADDFTLYSSWMEEPELCVCTPGSNAPSSITVAAPTGGTPSDPSITLLPFLAIQGIVELRTITGYVDNQYAYLEFNTTAGDGNGGAYVFDAADTTTDDSTDHIKPSDILAANPGRWVRQNNP